MVKYINKKYLTGFHIMLVLVLSIMSFPLGAIAETSTALNRNASLLEDYDYGSLVFSKDIRDAEHADVLVPFECGDDTFLFLSAGNVIGNEMYVLDSSAGVISIKLQFFDDAGADDVGAVEFKMVFESGTELVFFIEVINSLLDPPSDGNHDEDENEAHEHDLSIGNTLVDNTLVDNTLAEDGHIHEYPDCTCKTGTNRHEEGCHYYRGPYCICGNEDGPHREDCALYHEPIYTEITDMIDALPSLEEVMALDYVGIRDIHDAILAINRAIDGRLGEDITNSDVCYAFDNEIGEARINKYNEIFAFTSEYLANNGMSRFSTPTATITVSNDFRFVIGHTMATRYKGFTNAVDGYIYDISNGLIVTGTASHGSVAIGGEPDDVKIIEVLPGVTTHLYLYDLNISLENGTCIETTGADVTITLLDETSNSLFVRGYYDGGPWMPENTWNGGAIVKNGMNGSLTIRCEHADEQDHMCLASGPGRCGSLRAESKEQHIAAIGSSYFGGVISRYPADGNRYVENGGFSNLYIKGGIIIADAGHHTPGIGSMCGTTYLNYTGSRATADSIANPQSLRGQICSNIVITGGRVYAYGGDGCAGIGSGWAGPVNGIHINNGAFVHAEGGTDEGWNSPGIGSGGTTRDEPNNIRSAGAFDVTDIQITGGKTIVEAIGSNHLQYDKNVLNQHRVGHVAGIGSGVSYGYINTSLNNVLGTVSNVYAHPEEDWLSIIKQGTSKSDAYFTNNTPNEEDSAINTNMYYNLVYFTQIDKIAQVNTEDPTKGTRRNPIQVEAGDVITYFINTANWATESGTYTIEDKIPAGLSLVPNSASPAGMLSEQNPDGTVTVRWTTSMSGAQEFSFQVIVDPIAAGSMRYVNRGFLNATANSTSVQVPTTKTYHEQYVPNNISFIKIDENDATNVLPGAVFNLYKCTRADHVNNHSNHEDDENISCEWGPSSLVGTATSDSDGRVTFSDVDIDNVYVLVEITAPEGYVLPQVPAMNSNDNIIKVTLDTNGSITYFSGRGKFETLAAGTGENCVVANEQKTTRLRVKKEIADFDSMSQGRQTELALHPFFITLSSGVNGSTALKHGEVTKDMLLNMTQPTMTVQVSELKMMEFDADCVVTAEIIHADGTLSTTYGEQIVIKRGDDITITVTNTFEHTPYFKNWAAVTNTFSASR